MATSRLRLTVFFAAIAALVLTLASLAPALASATGSPSSQPVLADHVECNLTVDAEGNLFLDGVALAGAELAAVEALLTDTDLAAAMELAGDADAEVCLNLQLLPAPVITGHIDICGSVSWNGQGVVINGAFFEVDLNATELGAFLDAAAAAGLTLCAAVTVETNTVTIDLSLEACATATLNSNGTVTLVIEGVELILDADTVVGSADLEAGIAVLVAFLGSVDLTAGTVSLEAEVLGTEGCVAGVSGSLTIVKDTNPAGSDGVFEFDMTLAAGGGVGQGSFELSDGESTTFDDLGDYTITEMLTSGQVSAGWSVADIDCGNADATVTDDAVEITIADGDEVTCTFTNLLAGAGGGPTPPTGPTPPALLPDTGAAPATTTRGTALVLVLLAILAGAVTSYGVISRRSR